MRAARAAAVAAANSVAAAKAFNPSSVCGLSLCYTKSLTADEAPRLRVSRCRRHSTGASQSAPLDRRFSVGASRPRVSASPSLHLLRSNRGRQGNSTACQRGDEMIKRMKTFRKQISNFRAPFWPVICLIDAGNEFHSYN